MVQWRMAGQTKRLRRLRLRRGVLELMEVVLSGVRREREVGGVNEAVSSAAASTAWRGG